MEINNPTLMLFLILPDRLAFSLGEEGQGYSSPSFNPHNRWGSLVISNPDVTDPSPRSSPPLFLPVVPNAAFRLEKETLGDEF